MPRSEPKPLFIHFPDDLEQAHERWRTSPVAPHIVFESFLEPTFANSLYREITKLSPDQFTPINEEDFETKRRVYYKPKEPNYRALFVLYELLKSPEVINQLQTITGMKGLRADVEAWGAGVHVTERGGYHAYHKDITVLPSTFKLHRQYRRVLGLVGHFTSLSPQEGSANEFRTELNDASIRYLSAFNRWILFDPRYAIHGSPAPLKGHRKITIEVFYYIEEEVPVSEWADTRYYPLDWKDSTLELHKRIVERADFRKRFRKYL